MSIKNVVLIGAGGTLGSVILPALQAAFTVTVLTRASTKSTFPASVKTISVADDYPAAELERAFQGQDAIVNVGQGTAAHAQPRIIDAAIAAGVKRYLPCAWGTDSTTIDLASLAPVWEEKESVIKYLRTKEDKITWTSVATGAFFDWGLRLGFLRFDLKNHRAFIFDDGAQKFSASTLKQIARATVKVLQHDGPEVRNKTVGVQSFEISLGQVVETIEKITGDKWERDSHSLSQWLEDKKGATGFAQFDIVYAIAVTDGGFKGQGLLANDALGLHEESLETVIRDVLEELKQ